MAALGSVNWKTRHLWAVVVVLDSHMLMELACDVKSLHPGHSLA